jgi:hypothetical protein
MGFLGDAVTMSDHRHDRIHDDRHHDPEHGSDLQVSGVARIAAGCGTGTAALGRHRPPRNSGLRHPEPDNQPTEAVTRTDHAQLGSTHSKNSLRHRRLNPSRVAEMTRKITCITCMSGNPWSRSGRATMTILWQLSAPDRAATGSSADRTAYM